MKITVVGCGRWGSCLAWYCSSIKKHDVTLYGRNGSPDFDRFVATRKNEYITLPDDLKLSSDLKQCAENADIIIVSIGAQDFRSFLREIKTVTDLNGKRFVLCMKGIECTTGMRLTEVFRDETDADCKVAVWVGPGHVQDFYSGKPSCMLICSEDIEYTKYLVSNLNSSLIRLYYGRDLLGAEVGAAAKNVMGIAAGVLDGMGAPGMKGALMARGANEISGLVTAMGGDRLTVYGLSHLGDYQATLFSEYSHNRMYGEKFIKGIPMEKLAEGVDTSKALMRLSEKYNVELPISRAVYRMIFEKADTQEMITDLFDRKNKFEFN